MTETARPGAMLKALRLRKGWKLSDVAERTGFPVSTLSKIENDKVALTYDKIARLSKGLDVDIGVFFAGEAVPPVALVTGRRSIVRKGDGQLIETDNYRHLFVATDLLNKRFVPIIGESFVKSIDDFGDLIRHSGEEYTYVLEGVLELHTELYAPVRLEAGDSIYFDSGMGHAYIDVGPTPCRILTICSGEESQLMSVHQKDGPAVDEPARIPTPGKAARKTASGGAARQTPPMKVVRASRAAST
ncbi:MAG TPA: XRE family transcriptional regulator [Caulobacteraceae bacterium]|jgi:transcriptional regulator with XRE-family HTH domain|nr:XRE family transcriptional regulator [Caulobacteraceae bacterium]